MAKFGQLGKSKTRAVELNPEEQPFPADAPVRAIVIDYPERPGWTCGTGWWMYYWFAVSFVAALCFRRWLNVNV
jgi:hypothetical protein